MDMTIILYAGAALAIVMLIIGLIVSLTSDRTMVEERLGRYVEADQPVIGDKQSSSIVTDWFNDQVTRIILW